MGDRQSTALLVVGADALIAASVAAAAASWATLRRRHFSMLADVLVPCVKP